MKRRTFIKTAGAAALAFQPEAGKAAPGNPAPEYVRANTDWLAKCRFGVGVHWTAQTAPSTGKPKPFQEAVAGFDLKGFLAAVEHSGADYVLFTATHALQMLPAPHPVIDDILPGRTCERDLLGELADGLAARGRRLLVYYNHSCNNQNDPEWRKAVGYDGQDKNVLARNLMEIITLMSERYGDKVSAWWFDSPYSLDARGPFKSVTTDMAGFQFPWEQFTVAAKKGHPGRLVTYNGGFNQKFLFTTHQDYWAGEMGNLRTPATSRYLDNGLQWFGWTPLEDKNWVQTKPDTPIRPPLYGDQQVSDYIRTCNRNMAPMTFNVGIHQEGTMAPGSVEQLHRVNDKVGS
jgi:hypothetical protein